MDTQSQETVPPATKFVPPQTKKVTHHIPRRDVRPKGARKSKGPRDGSNYGPRGTPSGGPSGYPRQDQYRYPNFDHYSRSWDTPPPTWRNPSWILKTIMQGPTSPIVVNLIMAPQIQFHYRTGSIPCRIWTLQDIRDQIQEGIGRGILGGIQALIILEISDRNIPTRHHPNTLPPPAAEITRIGVFPGIHRLSNGTGQGQILTSV